MAEETIRCPYCGEHILAIAKKCKHCGEWLVEEDERTTGGSGSGRTGGGPVGADPISQVRQAVGNRYEVRAEIGRGGMATVYQAVQKNLDRVVALKVLPGQFTHDEEFTERFHREARSAAALSHPNIITIYDEGVEGGVHYMAMEYIAGVDLRSMIKERGSLSVEEIRKLVVPVARGLAYAHGRGMVHRDIKSANILIGEGDRPVLTDFGIARAAESTKLTQTGTVIGTPEYMSPEQARGDALDHRADVYSLGVVLYEAATGVLPFHSDTALGLIHKITTEEAPRVETVKDDVEPWLAQVIGRCLEKDPGQRYQSCEELAVALESGDAGEVRTQATQSAQTLRVAGVAPSIHGRAGQPTEVESLESGDDIRVAGADEATGEETQRTPTNQGPIPSSGPVHQPPPKPPPQPDARNPEPEVSLQEDTDRKKGSRGKRVVIPILVGVLAIAIVGVFGRDALGGVDGIKALVGIEPEATLSITSEPSGAKVYLGEVEVGETPLEIQTAAGTYELRILAADHETREERVRVDAGERRRLNYQLTELSGTLVVTSEPAGASVSIGGRNRGETPLELSLSTGRYTVMFSGEGFEPASETVEVAAGGRHEARVVLEETEPEVYQIGDRGPAGGIVFYDKGMESDGWRYLEAWTADENGWYQWKSSWTITPGTSAAIGRGYANTYSAMGDSEHPVAEVARNATHGGHRDWFLPSRHELNLLYQNREVIGGFASGYYWSSSEINIGSSWVQRLGDGHQTSFDKTKYSRVRVIRAF